MPSITWTSSAAARIQHRQGGVIGKQLRCRQRGADQQVIQRGQPPAGAANPVAKRRTIQCDTLARQHLRLSVQRQRITEFADQHVRQELIGSPSVLLQDGHLVEESLRREGISSDEVMQALREHGVDELKSVRLAVLEVDGTISVVPGNAPMTRTRRPVRARKPVG